MDQPPNDAVVERARTLRVLILCATAVLIAGAVAFLVAGPRAATPPTVAVRPTPTMLVAVRDLARLETTELHLEKVIDLTDAQGSFFGLVENTDAILLIATGDVTMGVDLGKLADGDVTFDPVTKRASFHLPPPEIFSTRLDEERTYVYTRSTSLLAKRNEHLEARARQEAIAAMEKAARDANEVTRAKAQAEKELRALAQGLGATEVSFTWR